MNKPFKPGQLVVATQRINNNCGADIQQNTITRVCESSDGLTTVETVDDIVTKEDKYFRPLNGKEKFYAKERYEQSVKQIGRAYVD